MPAHSDRPPHPNRRGQGQPSTDYTGKTSGPDTLAVTLAELARTMQRQGNIDDTLRSIAEAAVETVPGAQDAGLSLIASRRTIQTPYATNDIAYRIDEAQYDTRQGPCLDSLYEQSTTRLSDIAREKRWPAFAARAREIGVRSMLSFQLYVAHGNLGALNLYSTAPEAFTDESEEIGLIFASHAAIALAGAQQIGNLAAAVEIRDVVGRAKGILIERHKITDERAFALLVEASQATNTKLVAVARYLAETGELPTRPL